MQGNRRRKMSKKRESGVQWMNPLQLVFGCICAVTGLLGLLISPPGTAMAALGAYRTLAAAGLGGALVCGGLATVDAQGVRLYKLWTFIDLPWEEVRCVGSFTCRYARGGIPFILISPLEKPWEHAVSCFDVQTMRSYFRHGGARSLCLEYSKGMRKALDEYCPLPWTQLRCERVGLMLNANALVGPDGDGEE